MPGVYIVPAKLSGGRVADLHEQAAVLGALVCSSADDANILITELRAPKRVLLHVGAAGVRAYPRAS